MYDYELRNRKQTTLSYLFLCFALLDLNGLRSRYFRQIRQISEFMKIYKPVQTPGGTPYLSQASGAVYERVGI